MRLAIVLPSLVLAISSLSQAQRKALHQEKSSGRGCKVRIQCWALCRRWLRRQGKCICDCVESRARGPADRPLLMFDHAGGLKAKFASSPKDLALSADFQPYQPTALVSDGGVAGLVWSYHAMSLDVFSADGKLKSKTPLDPPAFMPYQLALFPSGESLVSGLEHVHSRRALAAYNSFTAIYSKDGHLQKRLALPEDSAIDAAAELGDSRYAQGPMFGNRAVERGAARLGADRNVYLMRRTSPATVYVISSSGELLRTLKIEPPDVGQMPIDMQVAEGRIAVEFSLSSSQDGHEGTNFIVADAATGQKISDDADERGVFACYRANPERFTFLTISDDNILRILEASAK
jgi:hypothetical protein